MSDIAIRCDHLSKRYRIGERESYKALRDVIADGVASPFRRLRSALRNGNGAPSATLPSALSPPPDAQHPTPDTRYPNNSFWALNDVSFDVKRGEVVGIIGRNGAGKSTLLKILSRITKPTKGHAEIHGRVGSLLEVGTGFHPELTGRENIYLNAAILGMRRAEVQKKFDEIVAFAEVEKFIDTPVKRYSSGMYVRLAFAVAAHMETEVLLVDEVLAVGDLAFQRKCIGKMSEVAAEGRTVLFVSHNMSAVLSLCEKGYHLNNGTLIYEGTTQEAVQNYLESMTSVEVVPLEQRVDRKGDGHVKLMSLQIESMEEDKVIRSGSRLKITIGYRTEKTIASARFLIGIYDFTNAGIFFLDSDARGDLPEYLPSEGKVTCLTGEINLTPGRCFVNLAVFSGGGMADHVQHAGYIDVEEDLVHGLSRIPSRDTVICVLPHEWTLEELTLA